MELRNCRRCGRPFLYAGLPLCPDCQEEEERVFQILKDYLYDHPEAQLGQIVRETGVPYEVIVRFLRDGRLTLKGAESPLRCEHCGAPIGSGRLCEPCTAALERELSRGLRGGRASVPVTGGPPGAGRRMYTYRSGREPKGPPEAGR